MIVTAVITLPTALTVAVAPCPDEVVIGTFIIVVLKDVIGVLILVITLPFTKFPLDKAPVGITNWSPVAYPDPDVVNVKEV